MIKRHCIAFQHIDVTASTWSSSILARYHCSDDFSKGEDDLVPT